MLAHLARPLALPYPPPPPPPQAVGLGAGGRDLSLPNILRLWIGTATAESQLKHLQQEHLQQKHLQQEHGHKTNGISASEESFATETIVELQTQLDDLSPQAIAYTLNQLFTVGAVDVFKQAIAMKKDRLGTLLTVLCPEKAAAECEALIFRETTTLGIRRTLQQRSVLDRKMITVETDYGNIPVKVASREGKVMNVQPEFEDCARIARSLKIPFQQVHKSAITASDYLYQSKHHV